MLRHLHLTPGSGVAILAAVAALVMSAITHW